MNPLYRQMMTPQSPQNGFIDRFLAFKKQFSGDPQQMVKQMLNSGKVSQQQYDSAVQMANQLMRMMK